MIDIWTRAVLVATNGEPVVAYFWDDANSNGVRDAGEAFTSRTIPVRGHENAVTNTFQTAAFDRDALGAAALAFDRDRDGILDWWESLHADAGLSATNSADAYLDPDGDGLMNLHEHWADCDPLTYDGTNTALSVMARSVDERIRGGGAELRKPKFVNYKSNAANGVFAVILEIHVSFCLMIRWY